MRLVCLHSATHQVNHLHLSVNHKWLVFTLNFSCLWRLELLHNKQIQTFTHWWQRLPCRVASVHQEQFGVQYLAQGHLDMQLRGAGNSTNNLLITRQPAVAPELKTQTGAPAAVWGETETIRTCYRKLCQQNVHYLCQWFSFIILFVN